MMDRLRLHSFQFQSTLPQGERHAPVPEIYGTIEHFNPRSRKGSDGVCGGVLGAVGIFQSTLPQGERPPLPSPFLQSRWISIHAPARGATKELCSWICVLHISIHAPARGATEFLSDDFVKITNFNPRSRKGSDLFLWVTFPCLKISIHAPARGATQLLREIGGLKDLFQSTLPQGERLSSVGSSVSVTTISIHAPARGATFTVFTDC